jgi:Domain of unknown function (DUF927)
VTKIALQHLTRVVARDKDTWFSIHRKVIFNDGRVPIYPGAAHQTMRTALLDAMYWAHKGLDVYFANGAYLNAGEHKQGRPYPDCIRQNPNLIACKCLYMDVDVKEGAFGSTAEATQAMRVFVREAKLPTPTIMVLSGSGGFHVYWTMSELFSPSEFRKMAAQLTRAASDHGIHFDQQVTNDPTRLLRVADTWNFKAGPGIDGAKVELKWDSNTDVDIAAMRAALDRFPAITPRSNTKKPANSGEPNVNDDMALPKPEYPPVDIDMVAEVCPFIKDTLTDGGKDHPEPIWHDAIALACHVSDPEGTAHRLSRGHAKYTVEETDQKLATAQQARSLRQIGPPLCATIFSHGVEQCKECPHRALNTTPLSVSYKRNGHAYAGKKAQSQIDLPPKYYRGNDQLIYLSTIRPDETGADEICVFEYPIIEGSGFIERGKPDKLTFSTMQAGVQVSKTFENSQLSDLHALNKSLADVSLPLTGAAKPTREFFMAYIKQLQTSHSTLISAPPFGWAQDTNGDWGFSFAGEFVSPAGTFKCTHAGEGGELYGVTGDERVWREAADIVLTPDRPDLCFMAATSFGAPLIKMSGQDGLLIGLWSPSSGIGKTTSLKLNQAVWSVPTLGGLTDTVNYTFAKCTLLRHLPINYDEIKGVKQIANMVEVVLQLTGGSEKGRADRYGNMRIKREFRTNCNYASNGSIASAVREHDQGTDANLLRMLEMRALVKPNDEKHFVAEVGRMVEALSLNYGGVGRKYAAFLGANHKKVYDEHAKVQNAITLKLNPLQEERFWVAAISTTLVGARIANLLGVANFPLDEMYQYAVGEYHYLQKMMNTGSTDYTKETPLVSTMGAFLNEKRERGMVILDKTWAQRGRPPKSYAKVMNDYASKQWNRVDVQISGDPVTLRVSDTALGEWCVRTGRPKAALTHALQSRLGARMTTAALGSGSTKAGSSENVWIIAPIIGTQLEPAVGEYINQYGLTP